MSPWLNKNTNLFPESSGWPPVPAGGRTGTTQGRNNAGTATAPSGVRSPPACLYLVCSLWKMSRPCTQTSYVAGFSKDPLNGFFCLGGEGEIGICSPPLPHQQSPDTTKMPTHTPSPASVRGTPDHRGSGPKGQCQAQARPASWERSSPVLASSHSTNQEAELPPRQGSRARAACTKPCTQSHLPSPGPDRNNRCCSE